MILKILFFVFYTLGNNKDKVVESHKKNYILQQKAQRTLH
jgi:hypothetical protein